jgi:hypothetical protein
MTELTPEEAKELRVSLAKHLEFRIASLEKAIEKSEDLLNIRLESMNEFRDALKDQASTFVTCAEYRGWREHIDEAIQIYRDFMTTINAKADQKSVTLLTIVTIVGLLISVSSIILSIVDFIVRR